MTKVLMVRVNQRLPAIPQTTMMTSLNLLQCRGMKYDYGQHFSGNGLSLLRRGIPRNCCLASHINPSASTFTSSVGSPPSSLLPNLTHRHILLLNFIACAAGISAACFFCSVIPTLLVVVHMKPEPAGPVVARTARGIRENIVKSRAFVQMFFSITQFSKVAFKFLKSRAKSKA